VALYFVLVVPINFLVLSRLRKPELAWITAPAFAVIFAAILFKGTTGLYTNQASTATQGTLLVQEGAKQGVFRGGSQIFTPQAGTLDLGLRNVDQLTEQANYMHDAPVGSVDTGTVNVPELATRNLQFQSFSMIQRVDTPNWFHFQRKRGRDGSWTVKVENHSPYTIRNAHLIVEWQESINRDLHPGESLSVQGKRVDGSDEMIHNAVALTPPNSTNPQVQVASPGGGPPQYQPELLIGQVPGERGGMMLAGSIDRLPVGCQVGKLVPQHSSFDIAIFPRPDF
jgi:hypothetical protein